MNKYYIILSSILLLSQISCKDQNLQITVTNPSNFSRSLEIVEIPVNEIEGKISLELGESYVVKNDRDSIITSQITFDGKLIFQSGLGTSESKTFTISKGEKVEYEPTVFGRSFPERKNDFSWENDHVGFRLYADSLKYTDGPSNGLDIWLKRTNKLILDKWYHDDIVNKKSYHVDHGEGCDPYGVGRSLGAGAMAPFIDNHLVLNENFKNYEILDNGPLRISFILTYPDITINGKTISESRQISLNAGSQLTKIIETYHYDSEMSVAAGFNKREKNDSILFSKGNDYLLYEEPASDENGQIFLGVIIPMGIDSMVINSYTYTHPISKKDSQFSNVLAITHYQPEKPMTYYTGFGWNKFGFENVSIFEKYIQEFSQSLKQPFIITIK